jgi:hypothetical protein
VKPSFWMPSKLISAHSLLSPTRCFCFSHFCVTICMQHLKVRHTYSTVPESLRLTIPRYLDIKSVRLNTQLTTYELGPKHEIYGTPLKIFPIQPQAWKKDEEVKVEVSNLSPLIILMLNFGRSESAPLTNVLHCNGSIRNKHPTEKHHICVCYNPTSNIESS